MITQIDTYSLNNKIRRNFFPIVDVNQFNAILRAEFCFKFISCLEIFKSFIATEKIDWLKMLLPLVFNSYIEAGDKHIVRHLSIFCASKKEWSVLINYRV